MVVLGQRPTRRRASAAWLPALLENHPAEPVSGAWAYAPPPADAEIDAVVRSAAGRLGLWCLPTSRPWLNLIEMLWRHWRQEVTHSVLRSTDKDFLPPRQDNNS